MAAASMMTLNADYSSHLPEMHKDDLTAVAFLGSGGFGKVYHAKHVQYDDLAIKICNRRMSEESLNGIHREVTRMMKVSCFSNIVQIRAIICETGPETGPAIVMELMEHGSLRAFRGKLTNFPCSIKVKMMKEVALGMNYLHGQQPPIIHRDLKLENIFVGRGLEAKIGDLGLATWSTASNFKQVAGTLTHIAPEIFEDVENFSKASDVYSFGITLWELSTGKGPYDGRGLNNERLFRLAICNQGKRPHLRDIPDGEPGIMKDLMQESWDHDPSKRPSFQDIKERLTRYIKTTLSHKLDADTAAIFLQLQLREGHTRQSTDGRCLFPWECPSSMDYQDSPQPAIADAEERPNAGATPSPHPLSLKCHNIPKETVSEPRNHPQQESHPSYGITENMGKMALESTIKPETTAGLFASATENPTVHLHKITVPSQPTDDRPMSSVPTYSLHRRGIQETVPHDPSALESPACTVPHSSSTPSYLSNYVPVAASAQPGFHQVVSAPGSFLKTSPVSQVFDDPTEPQKPVTERDIFKVAHLVGKRFKRLGKELGLSNAKIENIEADNSHNQEEMAFQVILTWQRGNRRDLITRKALARHLHNVGLTHLVYKL